MADHGSGDGNAEPRPCVMIVDDDAEMRALLRDVLKRDGFVVREQSRGDDVIRVLESWSPDAMVLDNVLDGATGLDLLAHVKRRHPRMPVVLVTAFGGPELESEALRLGAACYIDKPFRIGHLVRVLRSLVHTAHRCRSPWARYGR